MTEPASEPVSQPGPLAESPSRLLSWLARRPYAVLALLCLLLWVPGVASLPAMDRDESRFAESSRQMLDSANFVDIRFGQVPRYKKPVEIYWLQAATTAVAGHVYGLAGDHSHIWTYRLPSLLGGIAAAWLTFWIGSLVSAEAGLLAGLLLGGSIVLTAEATIATTDAVLLACIVGMQGVLLRLYQGAIPRRLALWGWAALAFGILIKGPVAPGVAAATVLVLAAWQWRGERWQAFAWLKGAHAFKGMALLLAIVLPWLIAIALASHGAFFEQSLGNDFAAKVAGGQESHGAPPGYFLLTAALSFWPAILFVAPALGLAWTRRGEPMVRFLTAWAGGWWLMVEAVPTKLPHYLLPACPALAVLAALWLLAPKAAPEAAATILAPEGGTASVAAAATVRRIDWQRGLRWLAALQFLAGLAVLVAGPVLLPRLYGDGDVPVLMAGSFVVAVLGLTALVVFLTGERLAALVAALLTAAVAVPLLTAGVTPHIPEFWVTSRLAALAARHRDPGDPPSVLAGYDEPSLVFALGADTGLSDGAGAAEIGASRGGLALIEDRERPAFLARLAELQADAMGLDELSGFNYSRGRKVHVTVYRVTAINAGARPRVH